ncbi:chlorite dismutase family protein [Rubrivirga sp. S365]|uniref:Chlorite dismutase family protein n=1 Tax=Rubrivirga litoralis TaxID=3075598 RepID=A0ABU3BTT7_9BACT|nr:MULTISPECIES: chlorite dismutase family protein [unclassified Rubrivirga]MDT0632704.1 chlorite dismutase family protein [Rubrivirga sp. F394]MDT7857830.1 chlorite dismutase family protein [Rubrivirga sp. S365]
MALDIQRAEPETTERGGLSLAERGKTPDGAPQSLDRRLYVQLLAYTGCSDPTALAEQADKLGVGGVVYQGAQDPRGVAVVTFHEDPAFFVEDGRALHTSAPFRDLTPRPALTMFGRTYSIGYETDLDDTLVARPVRTMTNRDWPWAVWYPLRRSGRFERESREEQRRMLMEHGGIGRAFGESDLAHDVRLACHGLDPNDNDFVAGLVGKDLHPLSAVVQRMRATRQTSEFIDRLGPFFVGRAVWQSAGPFEWALSHQAAGH